jgi:hypothetical protein
MELGGFALGGTLLRDHEGRWVRNTTTTLA